MISKLEKRVQKIIRGQSTVELALVLPFLLLFAMGLTEVGFTMFDYMRLANANREGVRLASRGPRYDDETVIDRVVASGGMSDEGGVIEPYFDTDDNLCVIVTRIPAENGDQFSRTIRGTLPDNYEALNIGLIEQENNAVNDKINELRSDEGYATHSNKLIIVETYLDHDLILNYPEFLPLPNPVPLYFRSTMRVTVDSKL
jgi:hypothetical protein